MELRGTTLLDQSVPGPGKGGIDWLAGQSDIDDGSSHPRLREDDDRK